MCANKDFIAALTNEIEQVYYRDHIMDNTFVRARVYETIWAIEDKKYIPVGYCAEPEYSPTSGVAFMLKDHNDNDIWVHVPKSVFRSWLKQCDIEWVTHPAFKKDFGHYRNAVISFMKEFGASEADISLLTDETLYNGMKNNRSTKDVAWAVLQ